MLVSVGCFTLLNLFKKGACFPLVVAVVSLLNKGPSGTGEDQEGGKEQIHGYNGTTLLFHRRANVLEG